MVLKGKVAIVTGAARGIGQGIALRYAAEGAKVVCCDRNPCKDTLEQIKAQGGEAIEVQADLSKWDDVQKAINFTTDKYGRLDILVNNAGLTTRCPIDEETLEHWEYVTGVTLRGTWMMCKAATPIMKKQGSGRIINICSIAGIRAFADQSIYCAAKGGVANLTRELAVELAPFGIHVNAINPSIVDTPLFDDQGNPLVGDFLKELIEAVPCHRISLPKDIAGPAVFLAGPDSEYVYGVLLNVDGGWCAK